MPNPFTLKVIDPLSPFCDRERELAELTSHAVNKANVVVFSPRRFGKTSLVKRVQTALGAKGAWTFYTDLFMAATVEDLASRIAKSVYAVLHHRESLLEKGKRFLKTFTNYRPVFIPSETNGVTMTMEPAGGAKGMDLLDQVMGDLGRFIAGQDQPVHFVLDEFQEITEIQQPGLEGLLRSHIQHQGAAYFFVGSRRRILLDMFNEKKRPFYRSALAYPLGPLPFEDLQHFLADRFASQGVGCDPEAAARIAAISGQSPYYAQALGYHAFELVKGRAGSAEVDAALDRLLETERYGYEAVIRGLTRGQTALLRAVAADPGDRILSREFMTRHHLSAGGIQSAIKKLVEQDLVEKHDDQWRVVDPVFGLWLRGYAS